jgi:hypothetical protein
MPTRYDRITTTIEREWLAEIIAGIKKIEYRQIKPYWTKRFEKVSVPFELRLLNGMNPPVPRSQCRSTKSRRTAVRANTDCTSRKFWHSSIGISGKRNPNGKSLFISPFPKLTQAICKQSLKMRICYGNFRKGRHRECLGIAPRSIVTTCSTVRLAVSITICSRFHGRSSRETTSCQVRDRDLGMSDMRVSTRC